MKRARVNPRRATPRRRVSPQWTAAQWVEADQALVARSGGRCECCGRRLDPGDRWERHHRQRRQVGGDRLANLLRLRGRCHRYWTEHPRLAMDRGLIVSAHAADPATVPVLTVGVVARWVLLNDEGRAEPLPDIDIANHLPRCRYVT